MIVKGIARMNLVIGVSIELGLGFFTGYECNFSFAAASRFFVGAEVFR